MIALPIQLNRRRILILVLEKENIVRLGLADPIDLKLKDYFLPCERCEEPELLIAFEENVQKLIELNQTGGLGAVVKYLERGRVVYDGEVVPPRKIG